MTRPYLTLFGSPSLIDAKGNPVSLSSRKSFAILAMLAANLGRPVSRSMLADSLWSGSTSRDARQNLRKELSRLRARLRLSDVPGLLVADSVITLNMDELPSDLGAALADEHDAPGIDVDYSCALRPFLEGFDVDDAAFDEWVFDTREKLRHLVVRRASAKAQSSLDRGELDTAISLYRTCVALDEYNERTIAKLLSVLTERNLLADAETVWRDSVKPLCRELDIPPSDDLLACRVQLDAAKKRRSQGFALTRDSAARHGTGALIEITVARDDRPVTARLTQHAGERITQELNRFSGVHAIAPMIKGGTPEQTERFLLEIDVSLESGALCARLAVTHTRDPEIQFHRALISDTRKQSDCVAEIARRAAAVIGPMVQRWRRQQLAGRALTGSGANAIAARAFGVLEDAVDDHSSDKFTLAIELSESALALDQECHLAWYVRAWAFTQCGMLHLGPSDDPLAEARAACAELADRSPDDPLALYRRGWLKFIDGEHENARKDFEKSSLLNPNDPHVLTMFGIVEAFRGAFETSARLIDKAENLFPTSSDRVWCSYTRGLHAYAQGDFESGAKRIMRACSTEGNAPPPAVIALAACLAADGKVERASETLNSVSQRAPEYVSAFLDGHRRPFGESGKNEEFQDYLQYAWNKVA